MNKDVTEWTRACIACQRAKVHRHTVPPLGNFEPADKFQHVHIDIVGPLCRSRGKSYVLTMIDRHTRWPEAVPIDNISAETVAHHFLHTWVARFGVPLRLTTDQGRQFESSLFNELCRLLGVKRIHTLPYHPQANGCVERLHRTFKAALTAYLNAPGWTSHLATVLLGLRSAVRQDSGSSPALLVYGTTLRLPGEVFMPSKPHPSTDILSPLNSPAFRPSSRSPFVQRELLTSSHVLVKNLQHSSLSPVYDGPYEVLERGKTSFLLRLPNRNGLVPLDRLKPAFLLEPDAPSSPLRELPPTKPQEEIAKPRSILKAPATTSTRLLRSGRRVSFNLSS
jgi:hypothetical protein